MRKLLAAAVAAMILLGVVGTAFAENGSIWLTGTVGPQAGNGSIVPLENGSIWPPGMRPTGASEF